MDKHTPSCCCSQHQLCIIIILIMVRKKKVCGCLQGPVRVSLCVCVWCLHTCRLSVIECQSVWLQPLWCWRRGRCIIRYCPRLCWHAMQLWLTRTAIYTERGKKGNREWARVHMNCIDHPACPANVTQWTNKPRKHEDRMSALRRVQ